MPRPSAQTRNRLPKDDYGLLGSQDEKWLLASKEKGEFRGLRADVRSRNGLDVITLRYTHPEYPRHYRMPFGAILAGVGALSCGAFIAFLESVTHLRFALWIVAGLIIYFLNSIRHSRLAKDSA